MSEKIKEEKKRKRERERARSKNLLSSTVLVFGSANVDSHYLLFPITLNGILHKVFWLTFGILSFQTMPFH